MNSSGGTKPLVKIITDSAADIPREEAQKYDIDVLAIPITIDGETYMEGEDLTTAEFYKLLGRAKELPTTAQVTPYRYLEAFEKAARAGYDHIVCVTINAKGSGMFEAAQLAKELFAEEQPVLAEQVTVDVLDSGAYTYIYGHAVVDAARAAAEGKSREDVVQVFLRRSESYQVYFGLTNLDYARRSGRVTTAAAFVGEVLGFRPVLTVRGGGIDTIAKVRGDQKLVAAMLDLYKERRSGDGRGFYTVYADNKAMGQQLRKLIEKETKDKCLGEYYIGASVTINSGPTVFGVLVPVDQIK